MINKKGFTLTELLAVIAIVAILSIAAMSGYSAMSNNSKKKTLEQKVSQIELAAEKYAKDTNVASSQTISINKLILMGYLQPDSTNADGLALLKNPVNNDNMVCNLVTIERTGDGYKAKFVDGEKDCNIAREEIVDSNVDIQVLKFKATTDRIIESIEDSNEYEWVNDDILINVSSETYEKNARSISYEYGGNVTTKTINDANKARTASSEATYSEDYYNEIVIRDFGSIFNGPVNITYNMKDGSVKTVKLIIKIDQEKPMGYSALNNDTSTHSTKLVNLYFDDSNGSGVKGYYYSTNKDETGVYIGEDKTEVIEGDTKYTYTHDAGTMEVYRGIYYIRVVDHVGNTSEPIGVDVTNFDLKDTACTVKAYSTGGALIERTLKWYNSDVVIRAESVNPMGDYGAKYNFLEGVTSISEDELKLNVEANKKMVHQYKRTAEMDLTDYTAALMGVTARNDSVVTCTNKVGIDKTRPNGSISATGTTTYRKTHDVTISFDDALSGFEPTNTNKLNFTYAWSTNNTTAPTTNLKEGTATLTDNNHASVTLTEGSGMTGEYYLWIIGSSVHDKAENYLNNIVSE